MSEASPMSLDEHFLVLAPTGRDAALTRNLLERAGLKSVVCRDIHELCTRAEREGAAGLLIAEEVLVSSAFELLSEMLTRQESWSDLPILLFTGEVASPRTRAAMPQVLTSLGNVSLLDRPLRPITMISAAMSALRGRKRQYLARAELFEQQRAVRERDQFLAMLGHELRNPLSAIVMAIEVMDERGSMEHRILRRQATHLTRLVDDLLDVARVTSGKTALQCKVLDLSELVRSCLQSQEAGIRQQGIDLSFCAPARPVRMFVDPVRCEQIVVNLVTNAAKYTPSGGRVDVSLTVDETTDEATLCVSDTGEGIAPEMLPRVFDLFAQAEGTLDRSKGGMGIGLTLVRSLVELHHGKVEAQSDGLGKGSTFKVTLPLDAEDQAAADTDAPVTQTIAARTQGRGCEVLLVEDNADSREMLTMLLERDGHRVRVATGGAEGIAEAIKNRPEVMLVDIGLPGVDGYSVARQVRAALGSSVFMVALTGYGQPDDKRRSLQAGFDVHLTKPVDVHAIGRMLEQVETGKLFSRAERSDSSVH